MDKIFLFNKLKETNRIKKWGKYLKNAEDIENTGAWEIIEYHLHHNNPPEEHQRCDSQGGFYASEAKKSESAICKQRERENLTLTGNSRGSFFMEKIQVLSADVQACLKNSEKGVDKRLLVY